MAVDNLASIASALTLEFSSGFTRQYAKTAILLSQLKVVRGAGKSLNWDVEFSTDGASAQAYGDGDAVDDAELSSNPIVPATIPWGLYRSSFQISDLEVSAAMSSLAQDQQVGQIFDERMAGAFHAIAQKINTDLYTGTGTNGLGKPNIIGFFGGATDPTGTYATVLRSSYPEWGGTQNANGGTARSLSVDLMDQVESSIFTKSRQKPNSIACTPATRRKYKGLFEYTRRTVTEGMAPVQYGSGTDDYMYGTAPLVRDPDCPAGKMLWWNNDLVEIVQLAPPTATPYGRIINAVDAALRQQNANADTPLPIICQVSPLARNGQAQRFSVSVQLQLRVRRPNAFGQLNDINEA
jgi:hypothetical protein